MGQLDGRVAIVTGGSLGIGADYCKRMAEEGAKVVIADLEDGSNVVAVIEQAGGDAIFVETDVADEAANMNMVAKAVEAYGKVDILVANAGLYTHLKRKPSADETTDEWDDVYNVNIKGVWLGAKACIPEMTKKGYGKIINIASTAAFQGTPGITRYAASKAAVVGITRSMAREYGDNGIRINAIAPGPIETETGKQYETEESIKRREASGKKRALGRNGMPQDLTGLCVFLASEKSDFMSGQTVVADGGGTMW
ncbi:MAG: dehydrogenase [Rhodospirillaceae bacterium]|nr:dehydrogenase [Rhodospirillaceae bacterium]|tara:strand:+ start:21316 stop:22077 length:762 start_codon:yes stop_codon:yes gene_type:complete